MKNKERVSEQWKIVGQAWRKFITHEIEEIPNNLKKEVVGSYIKLSKDRPTQVQVKHLEAQILAQTRAGKKIQVTGSATEVIATRNIEKRFKKRNVSRLITLTDIALEDTLALKRAKKD